MMPMTSGESEAAFGITGREICVRSTNRDRARQGGVCIQLHTLCDDVEDVPVGEEKASERRAERRIEPFPREYACQLSGACDETQIDGFDQVAHVVAKNVYAGT